MSIHITALDHVAINVRDIDSALAFYHEALGLPVERLDDYRAGTVAFPSVRIAAQTILDFFVEPTAAGNNVNHIALNVDDAAAKIEAYLNSRGIAIERRATRNFGARGYGSSFYVRDPDGNVVELRSYRS
jgi:catechol 2,3-dioxygenase-like lactoylglutathione lyase family enzyme